MAGIGTLGTQAPYAGDQAELNQKLKASAGLSFDEAHVLGVVGPGRP